MPTVTFPLAYLARLTTISPSQLVSQAFDYGLDATLQGEGLEVEVTAERPDLLAAEGFVRSLNIYNGQGRALPTQLAPWGRQLHVSPTVVPLRPHIAALVVENAHLQDGGLAVLIQFQEKVTQTFGRQRKKIAIGVYDLDAIQGDVTYTAEDWDSLQFTPLHGSEPLSARQILTDHPIGQLYGHTLPPGPQVPVLKDGAGTVLSLPPIINAAGAGTVTAETRHLFIDVTGIQPQTVLDTVNILAHNFLDTGATVKTVDVCTETATLTTPSLAPKSVTFSAKYLNELMGSAIPKHALGQYLARMDLHPTGTDVVWVPTYRTDILSQTDIAGDLMVAIGLDTMQPDPTAVQFYTGQADALKTFVAQVGDLAQRMGLMEVKSFILTDPQLLALVAPEDSGGAAVQIGNAKSRSFSTTRTTLLAGLLETLSRNINAPKPINIYETGAVLQRQVSTESGEPTIAEATHWGFASFDARAAFSGAKAYVQTLLKALAIDYELAPCDRPVYLPGRAAQVVIGGTAIGHFGEIHPQVLAQFSFPEPICAGELDCGAMMNARVSHP
jgi:phenylalanyl-tRNA synthetase beta chain